MSSNRFLVAKGGIFDRTEGRLLTLKLTTAADTPGGFGPLQVIEYSWFFFFPGQGSGMARKTAGLPGAAKLQPQQAPFPSVQHSGLLCPHVMVQLFCPAQTSVAFAMTSTPQVPFLASVHVVATTLPYLVGRIGMDVMDVGARIRSFAIRLGLDQVAPRSSALSVNVSGAQKAQGLGKD